MVLNTFIELVGLCPNRWAAHGPT